MDIYSKTTRNNELFKFIYKKYYYGLLWESNISLLLLNLSCKSSGATLTFSILKNKYRYFL